MFWLVEKEPIELKMEWKTPYLFGYNIFMVLGWTMILGRTLALFDAVSFPIFALPILKFIQTVAYLEVLHSMSGLVRSPWLMSLLQTTGKNFVVWFAMNYGEFTEFQMNFVILLIFCWSFTEIIRYLFYALKLCNHEPYVLKWLRYSLFIVFYVVGVACEITLLIFKLPYIRENRPWSVDMPNMYNWAFDSYYFTILVILSYVPLWPPLYIHMWKQRGKELSQRKEE